MTGNTVQSAESGLEVVHAMPGRVRLRASGSSLLLADYWENRLEDFAQRLRQEEGVCNVNANIQTGSLVVTFDENTLSYSQMFAVLKKCGVAAATEFPDEEDGTNGFWLDSTQLESVIPLIAGALITGGLGIGGLPAIPVYLLAAGTTRQLIEQFEEGEKEEDAGTRGRGDAGTISLVKQKIAFSVVHAVRGRIRFQVSRLFQDGIYASRLEKLAAADSNITSVRVNRAAASVTFTYDAKAVAETEIRSRLVELIQRAGEAFKPTSYTATPAVAENTNSQSLQARVKAKSPPIRPLAHLPHNPPKITYLTGLKPPALNLILNFMAHVY
ncbi:HMA2 domain-containing protein [Microseira sp. BLCC-F43]|uniref:HMA2 domain-containing protein n=1 Tax=Microseira sp. BLCC-F43 TaxID=3153602 RepID=UPI0035BA9357